jgi:hypothetical protein
MVGALDLEGQQPPTHPAGAGHDAQPFVLRLTTREVLLDVVATDRHGHPVRDLKADEVEVFEVQGKSKALVAGISHFEGVNSVNSAPAQSSGLNVLVGGGCAARATFHYQIAFHPSVAGWKSGYHEIEVLTKRRGVHLAYRDHYYAPETAPLPHPPSDSAEGELWRAACYHPDVPATVVLSARAVESPMEDSYRYFVTVDADSLAYLTIEGQSRRVQLDYGVCTFDQGGHGLRYMHSGIDRLLSSSEYAQAVVHGFPNLIEFPRVQGMATARIALRDRATGNVGLVEIAFPSPKPSTTVTSLPPADLTATEQHAAEAWDRHLKYTSKSTNLYFPPLGPIGSFGSREPRPDAFCGDVYEIPSDTQRLPAFWNLSSVGSLYAETLNVPHQQFWNTGGLPGLTRRTEWFGIDYHGTLWISRAGNYHFELHADDGARLFIDDQLVIDLDGLRLWDSMKGDIALDKGPHAIHVPYMQGPQNAVGLVLLVKGPGESAFTPLDMRKFAPPDANTSARFGELQQQPNPEVQR